jgi:hypothetical protein
LLQEAALLALEARLDQTELVAVELADTYLQAP